MKKVLFFAAMLSFAVACGGEKKSDNNAEATVEATEVVEAVEKTVAEAPEVEAEAPAAEVTEKPVLTIKEAPAIKSVEAADKTKTVEVKEIKAIDAGVSKEKKAIKVVGDKDLKVSDATVAAGSAEAK